MSGPRSATNLSLTRITDVHIHVQPWHELKPQVLAVMWRDKQAERDRMIQVLEDPHALLDVMDQAGVWRAEAGRSTGRRRSSSCDAIATSGSTSPGFRPPACWSTFRACPRWPIA